MKKMEEELKYKLNKMADSQEGKEKLREIKFKGEGRKFEQRIKKIRGITYHTRH